MNLLTRLRLERDGLTESERSLADVILAGPERCLGEGAKQLARPAARSLAERGVPVVLVASAEPTPLDEFATVKLALSPQEDHARKVSPFVTGLSLLFVLDALFARCFVEDFDANLARRLAYYEGIVALGGCSGSGR